MRIIAALHSAEAIRAILECLRLPARAPPGRSAGSRARDEAIGGSFGFDPADT